VGADGKASDVVSGVLGHAFIGSGFVFGELGKPGGGDTNIGMIFAFQVLPTIVFVAALFGVLYYLGVMQLIVRVLARGDGLRVRGERGGVAVHRGEHLHGPERGAADDPAVPGPS
jgi:hypothetical protein